MVYVILYGIFAISALVGNFILFTSSTAEEGKVVVSVFTIIVGTVWGAGLLYSIHMAITSHIRCYLDMDLLKEYVKTTVRSRNKYIADARDLLTRLPALQEIELTKLMSGNKLIAAAEGDKPKSYVDALLQYEQALRNYNSKITEHINNINFQRTKIRENICNRTPLSYFFVYRFLGTKYITTPPFVEEELNIN